MYSSNVCERRAETQLVRNSTSPRLDLHGAFGYLLEGVGILHGYFDSYFGRFLNFTAHQEFIQDEISLLKVENDVQLTHLAQTQSHKNTLVCSITEIRLSVTSSLLSREYTGGDAAKIIKTNNEI